MIAIIEYLENNNENITNKNSWDKAKKPYLRGIQICKEQIMMTPVSEAMAGTSRVRPCSRSLSCINSLNSHNKMGRYYYFHSHFTGEETEIQK